MGLRDDMAAECTKSRKHSEDPCNGTVVITDEHRIETNNDEGTMRALAGLGCISGCKCIKVTSIMADNVDGQRVVISSCNSDPNWEPPIDEAPDR